MNNLSLWKLDSPSHPWRRLMDFERDSDRLFQQAFAPSRWDSPNTTLSFQPPLELEESDTHYLLSFDLPGVAKNDISIEVKGDQLKVSGERKRDRKNAGASQRSFGQFQREVRLPADADLSKVEAHHQDGVLTIAVSKAEQAKARQIKIEDGRGSFFTRFLGAKDTQKNAEGGPGKENAA